MSSAALEELKVWENYPDDVTRLGFLEFKYTMERLHYKLTDISIYQPGGSNEEMLSSWIMGKPDPGILELHPYEGLFPLAVTLLNS